MDGADLVEAEGIDSLDTMVRGLFDKSRLLDVIRNFVYFPDVSRSEQKILCRYPQYYATKKLFQNVLAHRKPEGDGKGGTYFGATGCGKSFTMLFFAFIDAECGAGESDHCIDHGQDGLG